MPAAGARLVRKPVGSRISGDKTRSIFDTLRATPACFRAYSALVNADMHAIPIEDVEQSAHMHPGAVFPFLIGEHLVREVPSQLDQSEDAFRRASECTSLIAGARENAVAAPARTRYQIYQKTGNATALINALTSQLKRVVIAHEF